MTNDLRNQNEMRTHIAQWTNARLAEQAGIAIDAVPGINGLSPDEEAQARDLAARSGLPLDVVRGGRTQVLDQLTERDRRTLLERHPRLSFFAADPNNAALVRDDLGELSAMDMVIDPVRAGLGGLIDFGGGLVGGAGEAAHLIERGADAVIPGLADERGYRPSDALFAAESAIGDVADYVGGDADWWLPNLQRGIGQVGGQIAGYVLGGKKFTLAAGALLGGDQMADMAREHGAYGTWQGDLGIIGGMALSPLLEKFGLDAILGKIGPQGASLLSRFGIGAMRGAVGEGVTEGVEQIGQNVLAKSLYVPSLSPFDGVLQSSSQGAQVGGIVAGLFALLPGRYHDTIRREMGAKAADDQAAAFTDLVDRGRETKTAARSPAAMEEILGQPSALGDRAYSVPADGLLELYQSGVIDDQTLEALKVRPDDIAAAALSGGDIEIAGAALAVRLMEMDKAKSDAVIAHLRIAPEAMTKTEAEAWRVDPVREAEIVAIQAEMEKAAEGGGDAMEPDARRAAWDTIVADVTADLKATGLYKDADARAQAQITAARTVLRAEQRGMNPLDLWAEERAKIEGPEGKPTKTAPPEPLPPVLTPGAYKPDSLGAFLVKQGGLQDPGGDLAAMDAQRQRPGLVSGKGRHPDDAALAAWEAGYFPDATERPSQDQLFEAVRGELAGSPVYRAEDFDVIDRTQRAEALAGEVSDLMGSVEAVRGMSDVQLDHALGLARGKRAWAPYAKQTPLRDGDIAAMVREADQTGRDLDDVAADWAERVALMVEGDAESKGLREDAEGGDVPFELWQSTTPRGGAWSSLAGDVTSFTQDIERVLKHGPNRGASARVGETPLIFNRLGVKRRDLRMHETKIEKILKQDHPEISPEQLGRAAALLSDPVMVMESGTQSGAFVAVLDDVDANGDFLIAAIHPSDGTVQFDKLASVYGKQRVNPQGASAKDWIARNINNGSVLYLNTKKAPELSRAARVYIPAVQKIRSQNPNMLTERHLVKARKSQPQVYQRGQSPRGSYTPATNTIRLFQSANMSTFVHESGHQWLFQMADDLGDARLLPEARAQIVEDLGAVLKHLGVKGVDPATATPEQLKAALSVEQHETFARTVEAYIREGNAPSKELRRAFRRLASWLVQIYKSMRGLNVEMTAEIRGVMDRLLANEGAIARERQGREVTIAPEIWRAATESERAALGAALNEAKDEAFTKVWAAQTASEARRRKKAYQAERTAVREELAPKVAERPEYRALEAVRQVPLDRVALNEAFGQGIVRLLPHKTSAVEGGANPEVVADMLGFENAAQLVEALRTAKAKPQETALKEAVEAEMQARDKDLRDPVALAEEARQALDYSAVFTETQKILRRLAGEQIDAVARRSVAQEGAGKAGHRTQAVNDAEGAGREARGAGDAVAAAGETVVAKAERKAAAQERAVSGTAKAQAEGINRVIRAMDGSMIKEAARRMVAGMPLAKLNKKGQWSAQLVASRYRLAAQAAGRRAMKAAAARDWATVQAELGRQHMAQVLEAETRAAVGDVAKIKQRFKAFDKPDKKLAKGTDIDFINAGRFIAAQFGLGRKGDFDYAQWLDKLTEQDPVQARQFGAMISSLTATAKPWQEMTVQELRDLSAGLDALREMGRRSKAMEVEGRSVEYTEIEGDFASQWAESGMLADPPSEVALTTDVDRRRMAFATARAALTRVTSWASAKDNGQINGATQRYLVRPVEAAIGRYRDARRALKPKLMAVLDPIVEDIKDQSPVYVHALGSASGKPLAITRGQAFTLLLNMGNKGNLAKLVAGYGWGQVLDNGVVDTRRLMAAMGELAQKGVLDERHLRAAEGVFALFEEIKPASQKAHKKIHGYEFEEVASEDIDIPGLGRLKGGYYPVFYDRDNAANANAFAHDAADQMSAMGQAMGAMGVGSAAGFTKARNAYTGPINLDASRMLGQFDAILRFTHIEPTARDVYRLIKRKEMRGLLDRLAPKAADHMLTPWLAAAVRQTVGGQTNSTVDRVVRVLSRRAGLLAMAGNVVNTAQQITGFSVAALGVKPGRMMAAMGTVTRSPKVTTEFITGRSAFMRDRLDTKGQEINAELDDALKHKPWIGFTGSKAEDFAVRYGYFLQSTVQFWMDKTVWMARYNQSIEDGESEVDAIHRADLLIKETQGSFAPEDVAAVEHGGKFGEVGRAFLKFYSYFGGQVNFLGKEAGVVLRTKEGAARNGRLAMIYALGFMVPAIVAEALSQAARGTLADEDDDGYLDDMAELLGLSQLRYAAAMLPGGGALSGLVIGQFTDAQYDDKLSVSPVVNMVESAARGVKTVVKAVNKGDYNRIPTAIADTIGIALGLPTRALTKPLGYGINVVEGDSQPEHLGNVVSGIFTGRDSTE